MTVAIVFFFQYVIASIGYDLYSYTRRQTAWEKAHPRCVYIRNYRKLTGK